MIVEGKKKASPSLRTQVREFRPLTVSPAMQAVMDRCQTPRQISPLSSPVSLASEAVRVHTRIENWKGGR